MNFKKISAILVILLAVIAAVVAVGLIANLQMWPVIILYWMTLTIKNVVDWIGLEKERERKETK